MTFKSTLTIVLIVLSNSIFAQQHHWEWAKKIGSVGKEEIIAMEIRNNYLYVCGSYKSSSLNWDGIVLNNAGGNDFFVAKLDTNCNAIWAKSFGTAAFDTVQQMEVNANGTCLLRCFSSANSIALDGNTLNNPGDFLFKINSSGSVTLVKPVDPRIRCQDVDLDNTGAIYVSGLYPNAFTFGSTTMDSTYCRSGGAVLKYSPTGTPLWASNVQFFVGNYNPANPFSTLPLDTIMSGTNYFNSCRMSIAGSRFDTSLHFIFSYLGNIFFNGTLINNGISYRGATFYAHLRPNGTSIYQIGTYLPTNGRSTSLYDVEAGANGLCYTSNLSLGLSLVMNYYLKSSADSTRSNVASWIDQSSTNVNPIFRPNDTRVTYFNTSEDGVYLLGDVDIYPSNKLQLFDSSTNALTGVC